jgi:hypothetical protein
MEIPMSPPVRKHGLPHNLLLWLLCDTYDGWVIGSAADPSKENPRDFDVVLTQANYEFASKEVYELWLAKKLCRVKPNYFGGWKVQTLKPPRKGEDEFETEPEIKLELDFWAASIQDLMIKDMCNFAWHPKSGTRWAKTTFVTLKD